MAVSNKTIIALALLAIPKLSTVQLVRDSRSRGTQPLCCTSGHHTSPHHRVPHAQQPREHVCHGVWWFLGALVVSAVADLGESAEQVVEADRSASKVTSAHKPNTPHALSRK